MASSDLLGLESSPALFLELDSIFATFLPPELSMMWFCDERKHIYKTCYGKLISIFGIMLSDLVI